MQGDAPSGPVPHAYDALKSEASDLFSVAPPEAQAPV